MAYGNLCHISEESKVKISTEVSRHFLYMGSLSEVGILDPDSERIRFQSRFFQTQSQNLKFDSRIPKSEISLPNFGIGFGRDRRDFNPECRPLDSL